MDSLVDETLDMSNVGDLSEEIPTAQFIKEFVGNQDSDVDSDDEEIPTKLRQFAPIYRDSRPIFVDDSDEEIAVTINTTATTSTNGNSTNNDNVDDNNWRVGSTTTTTNPRSVPFTGTQGMQANLRDDASPMEFFKLMVTNHMMDSIVEETNRYAAETRSTETELPTTSRFLKWTDVTRDEMWAFFGVVIMMGSIVIDNLEDYWSVDELFSLPFFRAVMLRDRFLLILSFLHLCNNNTPSSPRTPSDPGQNPLYKISSFLHNLTLNFQRAYLPGKHISVDEAMVAWRGPCPFGKSNPNPDQQERYGTVIKVFQLCDSDNSYCCNLEVFTGNTESSFQGAAFDIVDRLTSPYQGCGRVLYVDSYVTSPALFTHLYSKQTLACGPLRFNQPGCPPKPLVPQVARNDPKTHTTTNGTLNLIRFIDGKEMNLLTTAHDDNSWVLKPHRVTKEAITMLTAVHEYNKYVGAVDRNSQMVASYAFRRRTLKWWKKAFFQMFALATVNAYILFNGKSSKKLSHALFRKTLVKQLVQFTPMLVSPYVRQGQVGSSSLSRLTARHFLSTIMPKPGMKGQSPTRKCVVCWEPGTRRCARTECQTCDVGLHLACFEIYHTQEDFKHAAKKQRLDLPDVHQD